MDGKLVIRKAEIGDLIQITEIYNDAILKTTATFDTEPKSSEEQAIWFANHDDKHPILVAEHDGTIVAWASLSKWSDRCAYQDTAEISVYVLDGCRRRGIGKMLICEIIEVGHRVGLHTVIARITEDNDMSIHLHESMGFKHVGTMKEVGKKFGKLLDVNIMQLIYD
ncbi:MAG: L-amino acid N-acyltransferase [Thermoproteota archaeon]|nr:L-amino acid N-acyltransferase [Thermoproteota archaeon]